MKTRLLPVTVSMTRCCALPSRCRGDEKAADENCRAVDEVVPLASIVPVISTDTKLPYTTAIATYSTPTKIMRLDEGKQEER